MIDPVNDGGCCKGLDFTRRISFAIYHIVGLTAISYNPYQEKAMGSSFVNKITCLDIFFQRAGLAF